MKDYKQFLKDTDKNSELAENIHSEIEKLAEIYPDKTDRELITIAAKAHGYEFGVVDILNTHIALKIAGHIQK